MMASIFCASWNVNASYANYVVALIELLAPDFHQTSWLRAQDIHQTVILPPPPKTTAGPLSLIITNSQCYFHILYLWPVQVGHWESWDWLSSSKGVSLLPPAATEHSSWLETNSWHTKWYQWFHISGHLENVELFLLKVTAAVTCCMRILKKWYYNATHKLVQLVR